LTLAEVINIKLLKNPAVRRKDWSTLFVWTSSTE